MDEILNYNVFGLAEITSSRISVYAFAVNAGRPVRRSITVEHDAEVKGVTVDDQVLVSFAAWLEGKNSSFTMSEIETEHRAIIDGNKKVIMGAINKVMEAMQIALQIQVPV
jgi:hypothetical protein